MSQPDPKIELHEAVEDYVCLIGAPNISKYLHDQIDHYDKRNGLFDAFIEYVESC